MIGRVVNNVEELITAVYLEFLICSINLISGYVKELLSLR
jgi:hypothetical protein